MNTQDVSEDRSGLSAPHKITAALILAAGRGTRLSGGRPKQYLTLGGISVLRRTLEHFLYSKLVDLVQVVIHPEDQALYEASVRSVTDTRLQAPVFGGATRVETTVNGLESMVKVGPTHVLIHDGARPFVNAEIIASVLAGLEDADGAFAAVPLVDALWHVSDGEAQMPVSRDGIWRAQTPQGFRFARILAAHRAQSADLAHDDVAIARAAGLRVKAVMGAEDNFKITVSEDLERAEALIRAENLHIKSDN